MKELIEELRTYSKSNISSILPVSNPGVFEGGDSTATNDAELDDHSSNLDYTKIFRVLENLASKDHVFTIDSLRTVAEKYLLQLKPVKFDHFSLSHPALQEIITNIVNHANDERLVVWTKNNGKFKTRLYLLSDFKEIDERNLATGYVLFRVDQDHMALISNFGNIDLEQRKQIANQRYASITAHVEIKYQEKLFSPTRSNGIVLKYIAWMPFLFTLAKIIYGAIVYSKQEHLAYVYDNHLQINAVAGFLVGVFLTGYINRIKRNYLEELNDVKRFKEKLVLTTELPG